MRSRALELLLVLALGGSLVAAAGRAAAENRREYVNKYVLLMDWVARSDQWVAAHVEDVSLCRVAQAIAERQVTFGRQISPPPEFAGIHPHLLLILENAERMFDAAARTDDDGYRRYRRILHEEMRVIEELLLSSGVRMPAVSP